MLQLRHIEWLTISESPVLPQWGTVLGKFALDKGCPLLDPNRLKRF